MLPEVMPASYTPSTRQPEPPPELRARVEAAMGGAWVSHGRPDTGLSDAHRFVVRLADGARVFVKAATTPATASWLRNERLALGAAPAELTPRVLAWLDDDDAPLLVTEALDGHWPASHAGVDWRPGDLDRVVDGVRRLAAAPADALPAQGAVASDGWGQIMQAPAAFLGLGLCSAAWLAAHGEALGGAERALVRTGDAFVHGDMRSDNICLMPDGPRFVDWSNARRGAAATDLAAFVPAACLEGGAAPEEVFLEGAGWGAAQAAELALRAATDEVAPAWLRAVFRRLARINLDWAIAGLGLPPTP
jgi:aminoglycoside phosphotransferase (APT) family kinase protein